ncbi:hypothetical protein M527_03115 [Sphingobium indicum IP26]|uniref:Uncharacterized protein n=1 Tax=Sphingobium indicum F2 TaxID=1450518 RepID=A0A8E0WVK2_9SPHN|nr:hypothetical protein M527_03115 [Sphingobium indicum IP26]KER38215.1 hypothetical protein AL00_02480 [Sphingobium indicum F2]
MIGKILGAIAGERAAKHVRGLGGPGGALFGAGAAALIRRLGPLGLVAVAVGGYALKRHLDAKSAEQPADGQDNEMPADEAGQPGQP